MRRFRAKLVAGRKSPYSSWTFVVVPDAIREELGGARVDVRGTIDGEPFRSTVAKGEGVYRVPIKKELLQRIGVSRADVVEVTLEVDPEPRTVDVPPELQAVLDGDEELARMFDALAPSCRRAWASHVGEAKRAETRERRARQAPEGIRARVFPGQ